MVWNIFYFSIYFGNSNPSWLFLFQGVWHHQPMMLVYQRVSHHQLDVWYVCFWLRLFLMMRDCNLTTTRRDGENSVFGSSPYLIGMTHPWKGWFSEAWERCVVQGALQYLNPCDRDRFSRFLKWGYLQIIHFRFIWGPPWYCNPHFWNASFSCFNERRSCLQVFVVFAR